MIYNKFNAPLKIIWNVDTNGNPVSVEMQPETHTVVNGKITLLQIPDKFHRVLINGMTEITDFTTPLTATTFRVDYETGIVFFHESLEGQSVTVDKYYGRGIILYPASRIYSNTNEAGDVVETIQDIIDNNREALNALGELQTALTNAQNQKSLLEADIATAQSVDATLNTTINNAQSIDTTLNNTINTANTTDTILNTTIANANNIDSTLNTTITNANITKTDLENTITTANTTKSDLDNSISVGNTLKTDLDNLVANANSINTTLNSTINTANITDGMLNSTINDANAINDTLSNPTTGTIKQAQNVNTTLNNTITTANDIDITLNDTITTAQNMDTILNNTISTAQNTDNTLNTTIINANNINDTLSNPTTGTIKQAQDINDTLNATINTANTTDATLNDTISIANTTKADLDTSISNANTTKNNLDASITTGNTLKTDLDDSIATGNTTKIDLDNTITTANNTNITLNNTIANANDIDSKLNVTTTINSEIPTGIVDGINKIFTVNNTPVKAGSLTIIVDETTTITDNGDGTLSDGGTIDYITGECILVNAPTTSITVDYLHISSGTIKQAHDISNTLDGSIQTGQNKIQEMDNKIAEADAKILETETARQNAQNVADALSVFEPYDNTKTYYPLNRVYYSGSTYECIAETTGNLPTNTNYWQIVAMAGQGSVNSVTSTNDDIIVTNPNTDVQLTLNTGTGANQIPKLDANGKLPISVIPSSIKEIKVVNTIADRDSLTELYEGLRVHVKDASADPTVTSGWAEYMYDGTSWTKVAENESIDIVLDWANIQNKPNVITDTGTQTINGELIINNNNLTILNDGNGINFYGGAKIYKQIDDGLKIQPHSDIYGIAIQNQSGQDVLKIKTDGNVDGLTYYNYKVWHEGNFNPNNYEENINRIEDLLNICNAFTAEIARLARSNQTELDKWKNQRIQEGVVEITNSDTNKYFRTSDPFVYVALEGYTQIDTPNYSIVTEVVEGDPGLIGDIQVYDKASNGFKIKYTGSASYAKIRWALINPDV